MKKRYEEPAVTISNLTVEDVITTSNAYWGPDMEED